MDNASMGQISGFTVFAVIAIIAGLVLIRAVRIATARELAKKRDLQ